MTDYDLQWRGRKDLRQCYEMGCFTTCKDAQLKKTESMKAVVVPADRKKVVIDAAATAVSLDCLRLNICDKKIGMSSFADELIELGQSYSRSAVINVNQILPRATRVRRGLISIASELKENCRISLAEIFTYGGGITCDGVEIVLTGRKYENLAINYLPTKWRTGGGYGWCIRTKLLLLHPQNGPESAERIRNNLNHNLKQSTRRSLE